MQLPPKRFDNPNDSRFDPIRHKPWFGKLMRRRAKLDRLRFAYSMWKVLKNPQNIAAKEAGVDSRELRDYSAFFNQTPRTITKDEQAILDNAYNIYCLRNGDDSFVACIQDAASLWGVKARRVQELWDVARHFYPTVYQPSE